jgi:hypothetical protein
MKGNAYVPFMLRRGDGSTLSLDFTAMGGTLDSRFTFTRSSSTSTYIDGSGYVATASADVPRFDYDPTTLTARGLLIEGTATNLLGFSQNFTQSSVWTIQTAYTSVSATGGTSPQNTNTGNLFTEPNSNLARSIYQAPAGATAGTYTASVWAKAGSGSARFIRLVIATAATNFGYVTVALATGAIQQAAAAVGTASNAVGTVEAYPNGWYRIRLTVTVAASVNLCFIIPLDSTGAGVTPTNDYGRYSYAGNSSTFLLWGAQLESGTAPSSYIPTLTSSTVQRTADTCIAASTGFSSWFTGGTTGTFYADWFGGVRGITSTVRTVLSTSDVTGRHLHLQQTAAAGNLKVADFGAANSVTTSNSITSGARTKGAFSFSGSTVNLTLNGGTVATSSSIAFSTAPTYLVLGGTSTNGSTITDATVLLNGSIRAIKYWPSVLPTATLQSLTA